jgi:hypothetical protein
MRKFTTAVVVRLAAALAGTALSITGAQVAQAAAPHSATVTTATTSVIDGSGNGTALPGDTWPWS